MVIFSVELFECASLPAELQADASNPRNTLHPNVEMQLRAKLLLSPLAEDIATYLESHLEKC